MDYLLHLWSKFITFMVSQIITFMVKILFHLWLIIYYIYGWFLLHLWLVLNLWLTFITFMASITFVVDYYFYGRSHGGSLWCQQSTFVTVDSYKLIIYSLWSSQSDLRTSSAVSLSFSSQSPFSFLLFFPPISTPATHGEVQRSSKLN